VRLRVYELGHMTYTTSAREYHFRTDEFGFTTVSYYSINKKTGRAWQGIKRPSLTYPAYQFFNWKTKQLGDLILTPYVEGTVWPEWASQVLSGFRSPEAALEAVKALGK
jgi:hypothetical protein